MENGSSRGKFSTNCEIPESIAQKSMHEIEIMKVKHN